MMLARVFIAILILSTLSMGCGEDSDTVAGNQVYPRIRLLFAPGADPVEITRVVLIVTSPELEAQEFELEIGDRKANGILAVPAAENTVFTVRAYSADDVEYEGSELVESIDPGTAITLDLHLEQVSLVLKITPEEQTVEVGDTFETEIVIEHVKELFGYSFELEYDESILTPTEVTNGDLLGDDALFLYQIDPGILSIGATRRAGTGEKNGSGTVAQVTFQALTLGETEIKVVRNDDFALHKEDGTDVDKFPEIVVKDARVSVK